LVIPIPLTMDKSDFDNFILKYKFWFRKIKKDFNGEFPNNKEFNLYMVKNKFTRLYNSREERGAFISHSEQIVIKICAFTAHRKELPEEFRNRILPTLTVMKNPANTEVLVVQPVAERTDWKSAKRFNVETKQRLKKFDIAAGNCGVFNGKYILLDW
jgi:hypothetical protein